MKRKEGENFEDYKIRRKVEQRLDNAMLQGKWFYNTTKHGDKPYKK